MKNESMGKSIAPEQLQGIFLDIARKVGDEFLQSSREDSTKFYANRPEDFYEDFFALFDEFAQWQREIKDGYILRILKYLGAYDGRKINKDRLLTALRVICFIGRYCDDRNGFALCFKNGALQIPFDDVSRLERFVRTSMST